MHRSNQNCPILWRKPYLIFRNIFAWSRSHFVVVSSHMDNNIRLFIRYFVIQVSWRGESRMRVRQGIWIPKQGILGHLRPLLGIFGANGLFKDTFLCEGRECIPLSPLDARLTFANLSLRSSFALFDLIILIILNFDLQDHNNYLFISLIMENGSNWH